MLGRQYEELPRARGVKSTALRVAIYATLNKVSPLDLSWLIVFFSVYSCPDLQDRTPRTWRHSLVYRYIIALYVWSYSDRKLDSVSSGLTVKTILRLINFREVASVLDVIIWSRLWVISFRINHIYYQDFLAAVPQEKYGKLPTSWKRKNNGEMPRACDRGGQLGVTQIYCWKQWRLVDNIKHVLSNLKLEL